MILGQECGREMMRLVNLVGTSFRNGKNVVAAEKLCVVSRNEQN